MTPAPSVEERQGHEIAHYRGVAAQDTEAILGWQSDPRLAHGAHHHDDECGDDCGHDHRH